MQGHLLFLQKRVQLVLLQPPGLADQPSDAVPVGRPGESADGDGKTDLYGIVRRCGYGPPEVYFQGKNRKRFPFPEKRLNIFSAFEAFRPDKFMRYCSDKMTFMSNK